MKVRRKRKEDSRISRFAKKIDDFLRFRDFKINRTAGGFLDERFSIPRHSWQFIVLPALVSALIVMGVPEAGVRLLIAGLTFAAVFSLLIWVSRKAVSRGWSVYTDLLLQVAVVLLICAIVRAAGSVDYEQGTWLYSNFFLLAAVIIGASLILARLISPWVWKKVRRMDTYCQALRKTELFISRGKSVIDPSPCGLLRAFLTVIPGAPFQLLLVPAFMALIAPRELLLVLTFATLIASYLVLFLAGMDPRLNYSWELMQKIFFRGAALIVSLIIIALAAMRLWDVSYVSTVFDTAEGLIIALILFGAYVLLWWYDYWVSRLLARELFGLLGANDPSAGKIPYAIEPDYVRTSVSSHERWLQVHGASRFLIIGDSPKYPGHPAFQAHEFMKMFTLMASSAFPGGKADLSPAHISERILDFKYLTALVLVGLTIGTGLLIKFGPQLAELESGSMATPEVRPVQLLDDHAGCRQGRPALIVAASGGGTRAALYTASVLEGFAHKGRIEDVLIGSGVSGGGAALAYFAGRRKMLLDEPGTGWEEYFNVMRQPFIRDVINGAMQWRTVFGARLGALLAESFKNRWKLDDTCELGQVKKFGLILNTAIAGRFDCTDYPLATAPHRLRKANTFTEMAGGRLILTNLALGETFVTSVETIGGPKGLPVVVDDPEIRLEVAAALNANFPPVFSNAAIDIDAKTRYWVTDGGAVDNRGIEMLLYCLKDALTPYAGAESNPLPPVTVVVLDASAFSNRYSQDRGLGTMMSAGTQYASLLAAELVVRIKELYARKNQPADFKFINLPMPLCLRKSGSFGTHWMLQPNIKVDLGSNKSKSIKGLEMIALLRAMYAPDRAAALSPGARAVLLHAMSDPQWQKGARALDLIE
jgi:hypothetical protein